MTCIHHYIIIQNSFTIPTEQDSVHSCYSYLGWPCESTHSCLCQKGNFVAVSMQNIKDPDVMHSRCRSTSKIGNESNTLKMAETERSAWAASSSLLLHPLATFTGGAMVPMRTSVDKIQRASPVCHQKRQFSPFLSWLLEGRDILVHAKAKRLRLQNLRITFLTDPSLTLKSCGAIQYLVALFLSFVPHGVSAADSVVAVMGRNNNCQECRGNWSQIFY